MRGTLLLAIILIWTQESKGNETTKDLNVLCYELAGIKHDLQKRSDSYIWNNIKNMANHAWEYIKNLSNNTKKKIADWIAKIKDKAQDLGKAFEEQLNKMKDRINEMMKNIVGTSEIVKKCLKERKQEIDEIFKSILFDVTSCISNSLNHLDNLTPVDYGAIPNQTDFLKSIKNDVNICLGKYEEHNEIEDCIRNVRIGIYKNIQTAEEYILQNHTETRTGTEDILNTIVECTTDGIIKSTTTIANETVQIIECVSKG